MTMVMKEMTASKFKAECLAVLDEVAEHGEEVVVTKRGKAVARVLPVDDPPTLRGTATQLVDDDALIEPLGIEWDSERG